MMKSDKPEWLTDEKFHEGNLNKIKRLEAALEHEARGALALSERVEGMEKENQRLRDEEKLSVFNLKAENERLKDLLAHWQEGDLALYGEEKPTLEPSDE